MRLVQINVSQNQGSTGKIAEQIGILAKRLGWDVYMVSGRHFNNTELKPIKINNQIEIWWHIFISHFADGDGKGSYLATKRLVNRLKEIKPDIVHLHVIHEAYINYYVLFCYLKQAKIPVVWTFHDCWAFTGHCCHFDYIGCSKWKEICANCPSGMNHKKMEFFHTSSINFKKKKKSFTSIDNLTVVPVSQWLGDLVSYSFLSKYKIKVIKNGIDINVFRPINSNKRYTLGWCDDFVVLGVANGWGKKKGYFDFIRIAEKHTAWKFIMIGLPSAMHSRVPKNVLPIQYIKNQDELAEYYSIADAYLNPTYEDTYPTVNLEAMACGTPVVAYATGGSPETITDKTGYVVKKGDIPSLEVALTRIMSDTKMYYSEACRTHAENNFKNSAKFQEYIKLYNDILDKSNEKEN